MRLVLCFIALALCGAGFAQATTPPPAPDHSKLVTRDANGVVTSTQPNPEAAQPWRTTPAPGAPDTRSPVWDAVNMIFRLLLVLGFAYLLALLLRRYLGAGGTVGGTAGLLGPAPVRNMRVLETVSLGQGRMIHLVAVGERRLLVGVSGTSISLLDDVTGELAPAVDTPAPTSTPFLAMLGGLLHKPEPPPKEES